MDDLALAVGREYGNALVRVCQQATACEAAYVGVAPAGRAGEYPEHGHWLPVAVAVVVLQAQYVAVDAYGENAPVGYEYAAHAVGHAVRRLAVLA